MTWRAVTRAQQLAAAKEGPSVPVDTSGHRYPFCQVHDAERSVNSARAEAGDVEAPQFDE